MAGRTRNWMFILCTAAALALTVGCGSDEGSDTPSDGSGDTGTGDTGDTPDGGTPEMIAATP